MRFLLKSSFVFTIVLLLIISSQLSAQKRDLEVKDYENWESLGFTRALSNNGMRFVYSITKNNDENELRLYHRASKEEVRLSMGSKPSFSSNNQWLGYFIDPLPEVKKKSKEPLRSEFSLRNLTTGLETKFTNVSSFSFSDNGKILAMKRFPAKGSKTRGSDLVVRNLATENDYNFGNVSEYKWQDEGSLLALLIDAEDKAGNGVQLFNPSTGVLKILDSDNKTYLGLKWRPESDDLTVFRVEKDTLHQDSTNHILLWKDLAGKSGEASQINTSLVPNWPENTRIVNNSPIRWSEDGSAVFFKIKSWNKLTTENKDETDSLVDLTSEAPALQIWHSKDVKVIPEQEQIANRNSSKAYLAMWHIDSKKFVQLEDSLAESILFQDNTSMLIGRDATPYEKDGMFGRSSNDIYLISTQNGSREKILSAVNHIYPISPDGKFVVYLKDNNYHTIDLSSRIDKNITKDISESFVNTEDDHPVTQKPPYGFINWDKTGKSFFVNSKYDVWQFFPSTSKSTRITNGESEMIRHRYIHFDTNNRFIDSKKPLYISLFGEWSKKSGYGKVVLGKTVERLVWEDVSTSRIAKAQDADVFAFSKERYDDSPDFFIGVDFKGIEQISATNPSQSKFHWGKTELIEYNNANGKKLQGILVYPANYQAGTKYPMITYIYERLSNGIHRYRRPSQRDYYNPTVFSSQGYFVLLPDIVFDAGDPGISSVRTMEIAVKTVVDMGIVDEEKVGLIGHSWGGYQAGYAVTQTDVFAASVAGAGLTNLISMYGMVAWAFGGTPENYHFEVSQERMQVPPWENVDSYIRNSPVFNVAKLNTPLLFEVGDNDKNVDWRQGIEYYNSARRAGKQFVLLVYANEGHGLRSDNNRADYQQRILSWFGHYLKGEPAADWIEQGIPFVEQKDRLENWPDKK